MNEISSLEKSSLYRLIEGNSTPHDREILFICFYLSDLLTYCRIRIKLRLLGQSMRKRNFKPKGYCGGGVCVGELRLWGGPIYLFLSSLECMAYSSCLNFKEAFFGRYCGKTFVAIMAYERLKSHPLRGIGAQN